MFISYWDPLLTWTVDLMHKYLSSWFSVCPMSHNSVWDKVSQWITMRWPVQNAVPLTIKHHSLPINHLIWPRILITKISEYAFSDPYSLFVILREKLRYKNNHSDKHILRLKFEKNISISEPQVGFTICLWKIRVLKLRWIHKTTKIGILINYFEYENEKI